MTSLLRFIVKLFIRAVLNVCASMVHFLNGLKEDKKDANTCRKNISPNLSK